VKKDLLKLQEYQNVILEIRMLNRELSTYPESVKLLETKMEEAKKLLGEIETSLSENKEQQKAKESYLELCKTNLEKFEHDLMEVTNQKEYAAVLKEIDNTKKEIQETESAIIELMDTIKKQEEEEKAVSSSLKEVSKEHEKALSVFTTENQSKVKRKDDLMKQKTELEKIISKPSMKKFVVIAKKRGGIAIAKVVNDCCSACNMKIRPQVINEMKKRPESIYTCDSCQRVLIINVDEDDK
jgi:predicted  nucleic acid-binding Zn-ribbon protein